MRIAVLTYDHPHRKTQDVLFRCKALGYEVIVIATPWQERKNFIPLFKHRPDSFIDIPLEEFCKNMKYVLFKTDDLQQTLDELKPGVSIIAGAGILDIDGHRIINSHPGYLPYTRGLDAVKWAIYHGNPVGVTTYYIHKEVDEGDIIDRTLINVDEMEDWYSFCMRVYEKEIEMLVDAIGREPREIDDNYVGMPLRRMPHRLEMVMMEKYNRLKI
jgi:methionyl-tRNA formyltransferase